MVLPQKALRHPRERHSRTTCLFVSDRLKSEEPGLFADLRSALQSVPIEAIPGTADIWCRDYMPIQVAENRFLRFLYCPDYLRGHRHLITPPARCRLPFMGDYREVPIVLDGGNVVASRSRVILTEKIYRENPSIEPSRLRDRLGELFRAECVFIPKEPYDPVGHSDGVVRFVSEDRVLVNDYSGVDPGYGARLEKILKTHQLEVVTLPVFEENGGLPGDGIPSAVGLYINYLRVGDVVVLPGFERSEDAVAVEKMRQVLHLVSAWATANRLTLGQVAVNEKSNEITAIPQLLELLDVAGAIVTIDAMGCQKEIARQIREGDGHYVLAVKNNQERLFDDIETSFATELEQAEQEGRSSYHRTVEQKHGRIESRHYFTIDQPRGIRDEALWKDLRTICMVVSERQVVGEAATSEIRYYIGSKQAKAKEYARYVRGHWGIENSLHWVLDMMFDEDRNRTRKDHGPENLAWMRRLAIAVLSNTKSCSGSIRTKQLHAILDDQVLEEMLSTFSRR